MVVILSPFPHRTGQAGRFFGAQGVLVGSRLTSRVDRRVTDALLAIDRSPACSRSRAALRISLVNLTQPSGELGVVVPVELDDLQFRMHARKPDKNAGD
jgi:hypothetical protein